MRDTTTAGFCITNAAKLRPTNPKSIMGAWRLQAKLPLVKAFMPDAFCILKAASQLPPIPANQEHRGPFDIERTARIVLGSGVPQAWLPSAAVSKLRLNTNTPNSDCG